MSDYWIGPLVNAGNVFLLLSCGANAYVLWNCASKKEKAATAEAKKSLIRPMVAEPLKVDKTSHSDEKQSDSMAEKEKEKKKEKEIGKEKEKEKEEKKVKEEKKKSKMLILKEGKKSKKDEKEKTKKDEKKKKEESKKVILKEKKKKETSESKSSEEEEKPPEPGSDPRKIWAFNTAKLVSLDRRNRSLVNASSVAQYIVSAFGC